MDNDLMEANKEDVIIVRVSKQEKENAINRSIEFKFKSLSCFIRYLLRGGKV